MKITALAALALLLLLAALQLAAPDAEWIPFSFHRQAYVYVDVEVNGVATQAVLDSGANMSCVSATMAETLGLDGGTRLEARGVGGTMPAEFFTGVEFVVGGRTLGPTNVIAIDLDGVEQAIGRPMDVILGRDVFMQHVVDIDYARRRLALRDGQDFRYEGEGTILPLHDTGSGHWSVDVLIAGRSVRCVVDSGSGKPMSLSASFAEEAGLPGEGKPSSTTLSGGAGGVFPARIFTLPSLELGGTVLTSIPATLAKEDDPRSTRRREVGSFGTPLLSRFRVLFDAARGRLILEADPARLAEPFARDRLGLLTRLEDDGLRVKHVAPGSPAAAAGWTADTLIVSIDGQLVVPDSWELRHGWNECAPGTRVELIDGEGRTRVLVAADYF
jgi:predicted aspartyl protease